jgi:hypothetical protein
MSENIAIKNRIDSITEINAYNLQKEDGETICPNVLNVLDNAILLMKNIGSKSINGEVIKTCVPYKKGELCTELLETKNLGLDVNLIYWKNNIKQVVDIIIKIINKKNVEYQDLMTIRSLIYEVYITNIDENEIINELFFELNNKIKSKEKLISKLFRKYDYRNIIGKRLMIQLEALLFSLIKELV